MDLLERDEPLAILNDCWRKASAGHGNVVAITGEAGIGKTSLSLGFSESLPADARVFRGSCEDFSVAEPLGPLLDIASQAGWSVPVDLPEKGVGHSVFVDALETFSHPNVPTEILIEDLHWADDATLDFLRFAARRLRDYRTLIVVTSRDDPQEGRSQLRRAFGDAPSDCMTRLSLAPLSEAAVRVLSDKVGKDADAVFRETEGNPFFVSELLRAEAGSIPRSVEDAVLARAARLGDAAGNLLETCSIFPRRVEVETIEKIVGDGFREGLDSCLSSGLLSLNSPHLEFRHDLARRAIESSLSWAQAVRLHQNALDVLSSLPTSPKSALLHHAVRAQVTDGVSELAQAAAAEAVKFNSNREAAKYFKIAIETAKDLPTLDEVRLRQECAWSHYLSGSFPTAIDMQQHAMELLRTTTDQVALGDCLRKLGRYQWYGSASRKYSEQSVRAAVDCLEAFPGPEQAMAHSSLSQLLMLAWKLEPAKEYAERAIDFASENGRDDILCHAYNNLAICLNWTDPERGRDLLRESIAIAKKGDRFDDVARGYLNWCEFEYRRLDFVRGCSLAEAGLAICLEHELDGYIRYISGLHAWHLLSLGRWAAALESAESGLKPMFDDSRNQGNFPPAMAFIQLMSRTGRGADDRVSEELKHARQWTGETQHLWIYATTIAERAWLGLSDLPNAIQLLHDVLKASPYQNMVPEAAVWLRRLDPTFEPAELAGFDTPYRLHLSGDWKAAAEEWERLGAPYNRALALAEGDEPARNLAIEILEGLGAKAVIARVQVDMQRDGMNVARRGPRPSTKENPLGLTKRQMDVLELLKEGLSNAQIAERLFVSPKTVDHHVSAILGKLDASTRGEAVAKARAQGV